MPHILEQLAISVGLADPATESNKRHDARAHSNVRDATFYSKPPRLRVPEKLGWVLSTLRSQRAGPRNFVTIISGGREHPGTGLARHDLGFTIPVYRRVHGKRLDRRVPRGRRTGLCRRQAELRTRRCHAGSHVCGRRCRWLVRRTPQLQHYQCAPTRHTRVAPGWPRMAAQEQHHQQCVASQHQHRRGASHKRFPAHGQHHRPLTAPAPCHAPGHASPGCCSRRSTRRSDLRSVGLCAQVRSAR